MNKKICFSKITVFFSLFVLLAIGLTFIVWRMNISKQVISSRAAETQEGCFYLSLSECRDAYDNECVRGSCRRCPEGGYRCAESAVSVPTIIPMDLSVETAIPEACQKLVAEGFLPEDGWSTMTQTRYLKVCEGKTYFNRTLFEKESIGLSIPFGSEVIADCKGEKVSVDDILAQNTCAQLMFAAQGKATGTPSCLFAYYWQLLSEKMKAKNITKEQVSGGNCKTTERQGESGVKILFVNVPGLDK